MVNGSKLRVFTGAREAPNVGSVSLCLYRFFKLQFCHFLNPKREKYYSRSGERLIFRHLDPKKGQTILEKGAIIETLRDFFLAMIVDKNINCMLEFKIY